MTPLEPRILLCPLAVLVALLALEGAAAAGSASPVPIVVELFTSEGCSSCPPADSFLRALDSSQPVAGAQLIVMEEHVDYWDDQGWKDPFSSHAATMRQMAYAERMRLQGPYTPEMVVDGGAEFVGSDRRKAAEIFDKALNLPMIGVRFASLQSGNGTVTGRIETDAIPRKADILVAVLLEHAESDVQRGENGGRHLEHVAVVQDFARVGKASKGENFSKDFTFPVKFKGQPLRVIGLVQEPNEGKILGAAVARLPQ